MKGSSTTCDVICPLMVNRWRWSYSRPLRTPKRLAQMRQLASSTFPEAGNYHDAIEWAGMREGATGQLTHLRQAFGVRRGIEADDVDHRGNAQLIADTRVDDLAVVVGDAHLWCLLRVGKSQREAVTLERIQRQAQPRQAQGRAVVPGSEHQLVHGQNLIAHFYRLNRPVGVAKAGDGLAQHKSATATGLQAGGHLLTERMAITDFFTRGVDAADKRRALQAGFQAGARRSPAGEYARP